MIKVYIADMDFGFSGPRILIADVGLDGIQRIARPVVLEFVEYDPSHQVAATFDMGYEKNAQFVESFAEALRQRKTPTKADLSVLGTLSATERHLEDLQILLKLKPSRT